MAISFSFICDGGGTKLIDLLESFDFLLQRYIQGEPSGVGAMLVK